MRVKLGVSKVWEGRSSQWCCLKLGSNDTMDMHSEEEEEEEEGSAGEEFREGRSSSCEQD